MSRETININDFHKIIPLCKDFFKLAEEPGIFNEEFFINYWQEIYKSERGIIFVETQNNEPVSMIGLIVCVDMCTGDTSLEECFFYADPNKKTKAFKLIDMAENLARKIGATVLYIKHTAHLDRDRLEKIYNRKGFELKFYRYGKVL